MRRKGCHERQRKERREGWREEGIEGGREGPYHRGAYVDPGRIRCLVRFLEVVAHGEVAVKGGVSRGSGKRWADDLLASRA